MTYFVPGTLLKLFDTRGGSRVVPSNTLAAVYSLHEHQYYSFTFYNAWRVVGWREDREIRFGAQE